MKIKHWLPCLGFALGAWVVLSTTRLEAQTEVTLVPAKDNTIYENAAGSLSNGSGEYLFVGNNGQNLTRRALLAFDLTNGEIPAEATIENVSLVLHMSRTSSGTQMVELHRVTQNWGEGMSDADGNEGGGAAATPGDATWVHTFFDTTSWQTIGGDFSPVVSASAAVTDTGSYSWVSTPEMVADVQDWLANPSSNFGWILTGNEASGITTKRFDSRDNLTPQHVPALLVSFSLVTGVDEGPRTLPFDFSLGQNYPNPFNPSTTIEYTIPPSETAAFVRLEIFNLLGQRTRTLVNTTQAAGFYKIQWDGKSDSQVEVGTGTYFYRLSTNGKIRTKRMVLLR